MNILLVSPTDPRETAYGGQQRTHVIWKGLKSLSGTTVSVLVPVPHKSMEKEIPEEGIYHYCFEKRYSLGWLLQRLLKKLIPYWDCSWAYDWHMMHKRFAGVDVVVARYIKPVAAFRLWELASLYLDADDIHTYEYDVETRFRGNCLRRRLVRLLLGSFQRKMYNHAHHIWLPAHEQLNLLKGYPVSCLPNIPSGNLPDLSCTLGSKNKLLFVGYMCTDPNIMAIDWFLENFWADIKRLFPKMEFNIVGAGVPAEYYMKWERFHDVHLLGFVKDIYKLYQESLALITPMRIGMGSCIKVVESIYVGRCVVSTAQGLRGIVEGERTPSNGQFVFSGVPEFLKAIEFLRNDSNRLNAQLGAVSFARLRFTQEHIDAVIQNTLT